MSDIKFGTDGWRAKMGKQFSFSNVRLFAQAYSNTLKFKARTKELKVIINYDTRFLSKRFASETARILSINGIKVNITNRDAPLAAVSYSIVQHKLNGGINFTASFNKPIYNGIKILNAKGSPALPSQTILIEKEIKKIEKDITFKPQYQNDEYIKNLEVKSPYIKYLENLINFDIIRNSGIKIVCDNLYGTSRDYLDYIYIKNGIEIDTIHNFPYSSFGGIIPSCDRVNLLELTEAVKEKGADIGLATDIDGDRFGIIDSRGRFINSNMIMPPLIEYLIKIRKMEGDIVKSVSTTNNIKKVADYYYRKIYVTPVGFKFLAHMMSTKKAFIAIESTNGASLNFLINIKDGILVNLLITEMLAYYKMGICHLLNNFYLKFPKMYSREISIVKTQDKKEKYNRMLEQKEFNFQNTGYKLKNIKYIDGIKFIFKDAWLLIRESGTNNLLRIYAESLKEKNTRELIKIGRSLIA